MAAGKNHRSPNKSSSVRELPYKGWTIEINDIEELIKLIKKEGRIILGSSQCKECEYEIEIYDSYRE